MVVPGIEGPVRVEGRGNGGGRGSREGEGGRGRQREREREPRSIGQWRLGWAKSWLRKAEVARFRYRGRKDRAGGIWRTSALRTCCRERSGGVGSRKGGGGRQVQEVISWKQRTPRWSSPASTSRSMLQQRSTPSRRGGPGGSGLTGGCGCGCGRGRGVGTLQREGWIDASSSCSPRSRAIAGPG